MYYIELKLHPVHFCCERRVETALMAAAVQGNVETICIFVKRLDARKPSLKV